MNITATHETNLQLRYSAIEHYESSELTIAQELMDEKIPSGKVFFPPISAPEYVKEAFDSLSKEEQLDIRWLTLTMYANKNLRMDELGRLTVLHFGDPEYISVLVALEEQGFNYVKYIEELVNYTEQLQNLVPRDSYEKWIGSVHKFKHALIN